MKKVYISGPMTGMPDHNYPLFHSIAAELRAKGIKVINPAEINVSGDTPWAECLRNDIKQLCDCDSLILIEGWENSEGSHLELHIAHRIGLNIYHYNDIKRNLI